MTSKSKKLWKGLSLTAAFLAATGFYGFEVEPHWIKNTTYDVATPKWNEPPLHVAVAADFHVGCPSITLKNLPDLVDRINALRADIIVLPGDFVTMIGDDRVIGGKYVPPEPIAKELARLKAPLGVYAVLGNHDNMNDPSGIRKALEKNGIRVIDNDAVHIKSKVYDFWVAGLSDDTTSKPSWNTAAKKITTDAPVILVMHDPGAFLDKNDRPALSVAGHTHAGQVLPTVEKLFHNPYSRAPMKYLYGHISEDGRDLIVTSGLGTSIVPLRLEARPEIVDVKLEAAPKAPEPNQPPETKPPGPNGPAPIA
jgi:predicted MPP superfamily phosphohydrolase